MIENIIKVKIYYYIQMINSSVLKQLVTTIIKKYEDDFFSYAASKKMHHNREGGLSNHVLTMLEISEKLGNIYPDVNLDYIYSAIILHDMGKVLEYLDKDAKKRSLEGALHGHISIIVEEISHFNIINLTKQDKEQITVLKHIILSHHGVYEYGSPVLPMTLEAVIVNFIDDLDSKIDILIGELGKISEGEFTKSLLAFDGRKFYRTK